MTETVVANTLTESFVIEGGQPLHGKVRAAGNKNGVLPILAACVLTSEPVELHNVPRIRDVDTMLELLADIGVEVDWTGPNDVRVHAAVRSTDRADAESMLWEVESLLCCGPAGGGGYRGQISPSVVTHSALIEREAVVTRHRMLVA